MDIYSPSGAETKHGRKKLEFNRCGKRKNTLRQTLPNRIGDPFKLFDARAHRRPQATNKRSIIGTLDKPNLNRLKAPAARPNEHSAKRSTHVFVAETTQQPRPTIETTINSPVPLIGRNFSLDHENTYQEREREPNQPRSTCPPALIYSPTDRQTKQRTTPQTWRPRRARHTLDRCPNPPKPDR